MAGADGYRDDCDCEACKMRRALERAQRTVNELQAQLRSWQVALAAALQQDGDRAGIGYTHDVARQIVASGAIPYQPPTRRK